MLARATPLCTKDVKHGHPFRPLIKKRFFTTEHRAHGVRSSIVMSQSRYLLSRYSNSPLTKIRDSHGG